MNYENYHVHVKNITTVKKLFNIINAKYNDIKKMSIVNHGFMFDPDFIQDLGARFDIEYVPGFGVDLKDGTELNIYYPEKDSSSLLKDLKKEKTNYMYLLLEELVEFGRPICVEYLLDRTEANGLHELDVSDLCEELIQPYNEYEDCYNYDVSYNMYIEPIIHRIKRIYPTLDNILDRLNGEEIFLTENSDTNLLLRKEVSGIIINKNPSLEKYVMDNFKGKLILQGSGEFL